MTCTDSRRTVPCALIAACCDNGSPKFSNSQTTRERQNQSADSLGVFVVVAPRALQQELLAQIPVKNTEQKAVDRACVVQS